MRNHKVLLEKVERYTEVPMLILVVVMIVTLVVPMVWQVNQKTESVLEVIDWIIWALFALELAVKTYLSEQRLRYLRTHWIDVIVVVVPLLRVFRIFRIARLARSARLLRSTRSLRIFRLVRILAFFTKFITEIKTIFTRHGFNYLFIVFIAVMGLGTVLTYNFDQNMEIVVDSLAESLWLTVVNAFSGGYANVYPETPEAKAVSVVLIIIGTVLVSYFTASLASYFTEKEQDVEQERIEQKLDQIMKQLRILNREDKKSHK